MIDWSQESIEDIYSNKSIIEDNRANPIEEETNFKTEGFHNDKVNNVFMKEYQFDISSLPQSESENIDYEKLYLNQNRNFNENKKSENSNQTEKNNKNVDEKKSSQNAGLNSAKKNEENAHIKPNKKEKEKEKKSGRRPKQSGVKGKHGKDSPNNIVNKIMTHFFNHYIRDIIKKNSKYKKILLSKLQTKFTSNLKKQNNFELFKKKIKDILCQNKISTKYSTLDKYENKKIIDKIYEENKEINIIKILELT